jgi:hypothetical protein
MTYDPDREVVVLFGGTDGTNLNDETWEWDGKTWSQIPPSTGGPSARKDHALAYDAAQDVTVLFGGQTAAGLSNETWTWDGSSWTLQTPTDSPSARQQHAMAFHTGEQRIILFGGRTLDQLSGTYKGDTWVWDGSDWSKQSTPDHPIRRGEHAMAYDDSRNAIVLFGGTHESLPLSDTWEWADGAWEEVAGSPVPAARHDHAMAYDTENGRIIMYGGAAGLPLIGMLTPATARTLSPGEFLTINWRDDDPTGRSLIRLTVDDDRYPEETTETDEAEIEILSDRDASADGVQDSFPWQVPSTLEPGTYYIFGYIQRNAAGATDHVSVAPGTLIIADPANP